MLHRVRKRGLGKKGERISVLKYLEQKVFEQILSASSVAETIRMSAGQEVMYVLDMAS